ncbi:MAG TPA: hypothetical protein VFM55_10935 [Micromonosporaceae bacterium]|nr:hypothetical protein [Micromonosporaceae bacterium]
MKTRRWAIAGLAVAASLAFATGCGTDSDEPGTTPSPTPAPKDALIASVAELQKTSFAFEMKVAEATGTGSVDPAAKAATMKMDFSDAKSEFLMEMLLLADDFYLKLNFGDLKLPGMPPPDKWQHVDKTKLTNLEALDLDITKDADPAGAKEIFDAIVTAEKTGDRQYKGTTDLSKATKAGVVDEDAVKALGDQAKAVPFEATLDDQGRLTNLKLSIPAAGTAKAQVWEVTYSNYGAAVKLEKPPASEIQEAPKSVYDLLT